LDATGLRRRFGESGFSAKGSLNVLKAQNPGFAWPKRCAPGLRLDPGTLPFPR